MKQGKSLGLFDLFSLGFGAVVGVGWSITLNNWFNLAGGPVPAVLGFAIATICLIPVTLCFAELTPMMPVAGGIVAYAYKAYGSLPAFLAGWLLTMSYITILPWEAIFINDIFSLIFPGLKAGRILYRIAGVDIYLRAVMMGVILSALVFLLNWFGVKKAARLQSGLTVLLIGTAAVCIVACFYKADPTHLLPLYQNVNNSPHSSLGGGIFAIFAIAPFYFSGFDTIPQGVEEAKAAVSPKKLGLVIVSALVIAGLFYCLMALSSGLAMDWLRFRNYSTPALSRLLRDLYPGPLGNFLYWLSLLGTIAGLLTTWNGFFIAGSRLLLGMGRARLLPEFFSRLHPKRQIPYGGSLVCGAAMLTGPFLGTGVIDPLTSFGSTGFVIGWMAACLAVIRLRKRDRLAERPFLLPGGKGMAAFGGLFCFAACLNCLIPGCPGYMGDAAAALFAGWLALGCLLYRLSRGYRESVGEQERTASLFRRLEA